MVLAPDENGYKQHTLAHVDQPLVVARSISNANTYLHDLGLKDDEYSTDINSYYLRLISSQLNHLNTPSQDPPRL